MLSPYFLDSEHRRMSYAQLLFLCCLHAARSEHHIIGFTRRIATAHDRNGSNLHHLRACKSLQDVLRITGTGKHYE